MITLGNSPLEPMEVARFAALALSPDTLPPIVLDKDARKRIRNSRKIIDDHIVSGKQSYGINTGVGFLHHATVSQDKLLELQHNLILSHCVGVGAPLSRDLVLGMWIVLLNSMAQGHRGIRLEVVDFIRQVLEAGILAQVPSRGSVGASGDLAPSAHAALILFGEGRCSMPRDGGFIELDAAEALKSIGLAPLTLGPKEGLSLINGTQATTAMACKVWAETDCLLRTANLAAALSITGLRGKHAVFSEPLLRAHRHPGTLECGMSMARWIGRDTGRSAPGHNRIQDPYSLRCSPQVHGAVWEEIQSCEGILRDEINASTDNPLVFAEEELVLHGGNFHAIYPARVADRLASAIATLASISERRINLAMDKEKSGLPYFLIDNGGVCSGFMMTQTTAAALVSECKSLSFPASVDSIPTNCDQEDHVSMGPIAAIKALQIVENARHVLAIELMAAAQAIDLLHPKHLSESLERAHALIRARSPFLDRDRVLSHEIAAVADLIHSRALLEACDGDDT